MRTVPPRLFPAARAARAISIALAIVCAGGCAGTNGGSSSTGEGGSGGGGGAAGGSGAGGHGGGGSGDAGPPCTGRACDIQACPAGSPTTVTGTVYAPNGTLPLYNVLVYVPNGALLPIPAGLSCDHCGDIPLGAPGKPIGAALTDANGKFKLENFPVGNNVPVVIQVGKWRRQITVPVAKACDTTALTDPQQTRLPKNRSEGDMPRIAITTGTCDVLTCLLAKIGIDPAEFGIEGEDKAVTFYGGAELGTDPYFNMRYDAHLQKMTTSANLWGTLASLARFDMVVASCECSDSPQNKGPAAYKAMTDYLGMGGRLFGTDRQSIWFKNSTDPALATSAMFQTVAGSMGLAPVALDTSFQKGKALADWLAGISPGQPYAEMSADPNQVFDNFIGVVNPPWQVWGRSGGALDPNTLHPRVLTVNAPAGATADKQCGKAAHVDPHVTPLDRPLDARFPTADACGATLADGEKVLAFFLFDVAACIQQDWQPVPQPPVVQ